MRSLYRAVPAFFLMVVFLPQAAFSQVSRPDVLNYKLSLNALGIFNNGFSAHASLHLIKKDPQILILDLKGFSVDSVFINDSASFFIKNDTTLLITLPEWSKDSDTLTTDIYYKGFGAKDATWGGVYTTGTYAYNLGVGFTSNPHNFGRAWFPCADNFTDRATYDISIRTGADYTAVCGGILSDSLTNPDGTKLWRWKLDKPVPTYLAGFAVGKYVFVKYEFTSTNNNTIPVWLAAEPKDTARLKLSFIRLTTALSCFEERFGPYLFERVGYVAVPFSGGAMEHASNIAYPLFAINGNTDYETLMAHELAHHWWGDLATCRTAEDMWLNEGWASFCESVFLECAYGKETAAADLRSKLNEVLLNAAKDDKGELPVSGIPHLQTYGTHVYKKGALMTNVLRNVMGDQAFFDACKIYLNKYTFKDVSSNDLRNEFQKFTSSDLTLFFDQYIYTKGHYDVVISSQKLTGTNLDVSFKELNRYKTAVNPGMSVLATIYFTDGTTQLNAVNMINGEGRLLTNIPSGKTVAYIVTDNEVSFALAHTSQKETVGVTDTSKTISFANTLFSVNVKTIASPVDIYSEHHWVGPTKGNIETKGIRISKERYWTVKTTIPASSTAYAYFSYNGTNTAYLDKELLSLTSSEDSIVLLYRLDESTEWAILNNITFQPGGNLKDKIGLFWLQKLLPGDYVFGIKDPGLVGVKEETISPTLSLFPNPVKDELVITLPFAVQSFEVSVYDASGKKMITKSIKANEETFNLKTAFLTNGLYTVVVKTNDKTLTGKFIKN